MLKLPFDVEESKKTNILVSGANASGKTRLSCSLASKLHKLGYVVKIIDISGIWRKISDIPLYVQPTINDNQVKLSTVEADQSVIYDLSTLKLSQVKTVVDALALKIWNERISQEDNKQTYLFIEEAEGFLKNIRSKEAENLFRLVHVGRNIKVRCTLVTTDLALIDASVIRLCGLRFHGYLTPEENSKRKFKSYYGKDWVRVALEALDVGMFIFYDQSNRKQPLTIKSFPEYKPKRKARRYIKPIPQKTIQQATIKENSPSTCQILKEFAHLPLRWLDGGGKTSFDYNRVLEAKHRMQDNEEEENDLIILEC